MVMLIAGGTHTGKTLLAQSLLEKYHYPTLSIDHLKMGLIRSGNTGLTPHSPMDELTAYLWPIVREIAKTAIENNQNLVIEGCYIPFSCLQDFEKRYRPALKVLWLIFGEDYIERHFEDILGYESVIETRKTPADCLKAQLLEENRRNLAGCRQHGLDYLLIDQEYRVDLVL